MGALEQVRTSLFVSSQQDDDCSLPLLLRRKSKAISERLGLTLSAKRTGAVCNNLLYAFFFGLPGSMTRNHLCPRGQRYSMIHSGAAFNLRRSRYLTVTASVCIVGMHSRPLLQSSRWGRRLKRESRPSSLGTALGTSKSMKTVRVPSEATPSKRDIVFDFISHNPKVVGSNCARICRNFFNPSVNPKLGRRERVYKYLAVLGGLVSCCKYLSSTRCHGRGRGFESRRPRHSFQ
jgi:hypothetical protein